LIDCEPVHAGVCGSAGERSCPLAACLDTLLCAHLQQVAIHVSMYVYF